MEVGGPAFRQSHSTVSTPLPPPSSIPRQHSYINPPPPPPPPSAPPTMATATILQPTSHYRLHAPHPTSTPYPFTASAPSMPPPPPHQEREHPGSTIDGEAPRHALPSIKEMLAPERGSAYTAASLAMPSQPQPSLTSQTHAATPSSLPGANMDRSQPFQPRSHIRPRVDVLASHETSPRSMPASSPVDGRRTDRISAYPDSSRPPLLGRNTGPPPSMTGYPSGATSMPSTPRNEAHFAEHRQYDAGPSSARSEITQTDSYRHTPAIGTAPSLSHTVAYGYPPRHAAGPSISAGYAEMSRSPSLAQHDADFGKDSAFQHTMTRLHSEWDHADQFNQIAQAARTVFNFADGYSRSVADESGSQQQRPRKMPSEREIGEIAKTTEYMKTLVDNMRNETQQRVQHERARELNRSKAVYEEEDSGAYDTGTMKAPYEMKRKRGRAAPPGRCHSCNRMETPEWRRGPDGARTLCNACGLHYAKLERKKQVDAKSGRSRHLDERA